MKTIWFQGLKQNEIENFKKSVLGSKIVLDKLKKMCYTMIKDGERSVSNDYESPAWAYKQADFIGYKRALERVIEVLTLDNEEDKEA